MNDRKRLFASLYLCTTGLEIVIKDQVRKMIVACGGHFQDDFDPTITTHLIAQAVGSLKHRAAVAHELPVVSPRWVFESYRAQILLKEDDFRLKVLEGMNICTTGLAVEEQQTVEQLACTHGALYDGRLELGVTSVLIAKHPEGAKYEAAVANDIPVVHLGWLFACIEHKMVVDEDEFLVRPEDDHPIIQSTPRAFEHEKSARELLAALPTYVAKYNQKHDNKSSESWMALFDTCVFYLLGFSPQMQTLLQHFVRTGMGTIYHHMVLQHVTHVLVSASLSDPQTLETVQSRVRTNSVEHELAFVSTTWLVDSIKCLELQPEALYPVELDAPIAPERPLSIKPSLSPLPDPANSSEKVKTQPHHQESRSKTKRIFAGYSFLLLCRDPDDEHVIGPMLRHLRGDRGGAEAIALYAVDFPRIDPDHFAFFSHAVVCTGAELDEATCRSIQEQIHTIQRHRRQLEAQEAEMPLKRHRMLQFVSDIWVNCCLAARTKLSFASHELFRVSANSPRTLFRHAVPLVDFHDIVACTSVYRDIEQLVVVHLLRLAGARVSKTLDTHTTHLICGSPFGMKYDTALKRKLHVVNARWILESLVAGKRLDEDAQVFQVKE